MTTNVKIAEVDYDSQANYDIGHIPNSVLIDWKRDINHDISRDILGLDQYRGTSSKIGIDNNAYYISFVWRFQQLVCSICFLGI